MNIQKITYILLSHLFITVQPLSQPNPRAIVVGAGPTGIATSLLLASKHGYDVTLLESSPLSQVAYDPTKAFLYNVNFRGQVLTKMFPSMHERLISRGVESRGMTASMLTVVPADPNEEIPKPNKLDKTYELTDNEEDKIKAIANSEKAAAPGYWVPRHEMVGLMAECIEEHNSSGVGGKISFFTGRECVAVSPSEAGGVFVEVKESSSGDTTGMQADLVVGADGMNSKVRECLANAPMGTWATDCPKPKLFKLKKWTSPASHLRIKVLQLPPQVQIPDAPGNPPFITNGPDIYAIRSIYTGPRNYLSLGLLPMKNNNAIRPTNIVTRPDHEIWKLKDGKSLQSWFKSAFPRMKFGDGGIISSEEWDRFAKAEGTRFPCCQYSPGLAVWDKSGKSGVVLVGDAIHAFPPDIGQGVNAGLMDAVCLDRALCGLDTVTGEPLNEANDDSDVRPSLAKNVARYQKQHAPEIASLIRLARFGAPYQYRQPHRTDRILRTLWTMNVALRLILNKISFNLIPPSCIILLQKPELTYRQIMRRADLTTLVLKGLVLGLIGIMCNSRFGLVNSFLK